MTTQRIRITLRDAISHVLAEKYPSPTERPLGYYPQPKPQRDPHPDFPLAA